MAMNKDDMKRRTKKFALDVIRFVEALPKGKIAEIIGRQLIRAGTSVGANYRAACRARSAADFVARIGVVEEEADESAYWMEILAEAGLIPMRRLSDLIHEAYELAAIAAASGNTARKTGGLRRR